MKSVAPATNLTSVASSFVGRESDVSAIAQRLEGGRLVTILGLLADEVLHGRFGFYYLQGWSEWLAARPEVRASISRYLRLVFATCEREFVREPTGRPRGTDDDALGLVPVEASREIFQATMESAVAPALERFGLNGVRAWRTRSLGA